MPTEYECSSELSAVVEEVLGEPEFEALGSHNIKITSCLKIKTDGDGEPVKSKGDAAQLKKVGPPFSAFIDKQFIIVFDSYHWLNFVQRRAAAVHKALMRIKVQVKDNGDISVGTRQPDVQEFTATLRRYGAYNDELAVLMQAAAEINRMLD